jgi:hypothetical protein
MPLLGVKMSLKELRDDKPWQVGSANLGWVFLQELLKLMRTFTTGIQTRRQVKIRVKCITLILRRVL